jgi:hypothetical protein
VQLGQAMSDVKQMMLEDIASGKGYDGAAMKQYTPEYKKWKVSKGRKGNVDLTFTGKMLKAMQVSVLELKDKLLGRIYFLAGERDKARYNLAIRKFFGLSKKNIQQLRKTLGVK